MSPGGETSTEAVLEAETYSETYKIIADWIRFADAKAGVTLTVNGILLGALLPTLRAYVADKEATHPVEWWVTLTVVLFVGWLIFLVLSAINAFLCILPLRGRNRTLILERTMHFHPAAISHLYPLADVERFVAACEKMGMLGLRREIIAAILLDSHLSSIKYRHVARAIWCLAFSSCFGFLYLVAIQF